MLKYLGRSSVVLRSPGGLVVYIDPYAGKDYGTPADLILVTHGHADHNHVELPRKKADTLVVAAAGAVPEAPNLRFMRPGELLAEKGIEIRAVPARNANHRADSCVGYVISFEGIVLYHAGDTSKLPEMAELAALGIGWALLPVDGFYNMGAAEAMEAGALIKAKRWIPIHSSPQEDFDRMRASSFTLPGTIVLAPGESVPLRP